MDNSKNDEGLKLENILRNSLKNILKNSLRFLICNGVLLVWQNFIDVPSQTE